MAANATKTKVFNPVTSLSPKISLAEGLFGFFRSLGLPAQTLASSPPGARYVEGEGEHKAERDMEDFSGGSDYVLRRRRDLARYQQGSLLQLESSRRPYMGND